MPKDEAPLHHTVQVLLGDRSYPVQVGLGTLSGAGEAISVRTRATSAVVVTEPEIGRLYGGKLVRSLRAAGLATHRIEVPRGDRTKNLRQVSHLYDELVELGVDRGSVLVSLGGGVVGDLTGFVAATYLRGISFVQIPTTLLAMVDASVGGKVGVNLPQGKNLVGAFHQPRLVWADVATLRTLPERQLAAGFAEIVKAAAIWDSALFAEIESKVDALRALEPEALLPVIGRACEIKAEVVARDERETDLRMLLNFGHTVAHAIESLTGYRKVLHGEAVSMGMVFGARRSEALGHAPEGTAAALSALLARFDLPTEIPDLPRSAYLKALRVDKKRRASHIRYVILRKIGRADTVALTPGEIMPAGAMTRKRAARRRR